MATRFSIFPALPIALIIFTAITNVFSISDLCPARCKCEDEFLRAACVFASLEVVPIQLNPEIKHLDLSNNRIGSLNLGFAFYDNLESLDLSFNNLHTLGTDNFMLQTRLVTLNVSNNNIRGISKNALKGLESMKLLDLSNNNITDMDSQAFRYASELEKVDLSGNSLTSLPQGLLNNLHRIKNLKLARNSLLEVPTSNLDLAPSLEVLDLSDNLIQEIPRNAVPSLRSLVSLNLANNVIRSVDDNAFERLPALLYLNLQGNNLTDVPTPALAKLNVLSYLVLSRNPLEELNDLAFRNLFELKTLDLRECTIGSIQPRAFADNVNLEQIFLDGNHELHYLPPRVLHAARYLTTVSLRRCNLSTLEPTHFPVDGLTNLQIGGNPLVCNCSIHWLWNVIQMEDRRNTTKLVVDREEIICTDEEFAGKLLMNLAESSLRCRLSPLYLSLSAIGCLAATAMILALIGYITKMKRQKRPFETSNRPELLVYVGPTQEPAKPPVNNATYPNRIINRNPDGFYNLSNPKLNNHQAESYYDTPEFHPQTNSRNNFRDNSGFYTNKPSVEGVYAVTDVTNLRNTAPEVHSLYRMHSPKVQRVGSSNREYDCDYDYDYYQPTITPQKPHVVFV
ncbi:slit homolog 1 protein-like [Chelonus insularis]|uniref:slit homolog 1 protein-like n=1 Tax=Chelonus insularis TaxID=460826 RepID=UPI0015899659|nr:slit homolog 1 protein-like [Chelonus insularis]XP_034936830.1 slit homolog 1 protein-like [Chelonus insularis]